MSERGVVFPDRARFMAYAARAMRGLIIDYARRLGAYLQATQTAEERAHAGRYSTAQAVIEETALVDFLEA